MPDTTSSSCRRPSPQPTKRQRRTLSCLPCRAHKLRCNRCVPCQNCQRRSREDQCRRNPPPEAVDLTSSTSTRAVPRPLWPTNSPTLTLSPRLELPLTPLSGGSGEQARRPEHCRQDERGRGQEPSSSEIPATGNFASPTDIAELSTANSSTVASSVLFRSLGRDQTCLLDDPPSFWKQYLVTCLPSQTQSDMFVAYFFENINWMYQAIHAPSFRRDYTEFWDSQVHELDLTWLALLFVILALGATYIPSSVAEAAGLDASELPKLQRRWYEASRQALRAGGEDSKPTMLAVQVFLVSQSYCYCNKAVETLNSHMGQIVRNAQALGLDKEAPPSITNCVERELRHRLWWDLACSDTFQSLCLGRPTLLQSHLSNVPLPSNCNDVDLTPTSIRSRPLSEPTEMSIHCFRARIFKVFNKLYIDNGSRLSSFEFVAQVDREVTEIMETFPWYLTHDVREVEKHLPTSLATVIPWIRHVLHSAICIQRVRMYRPFLNPVVGDSWLRCVAASMSALSVYKALRSPDIVRFQGYQKMHVHAYQIFSVAVALATFLLVEMPSNPDPIRADIELVIEDLESHRMNVEEARRVPLITDGCRVIRRILVLFEARCKQRKRGGATSNGISDENSSTEQAEAPTALVPAISSVFGGETTARRYLERCSIEKMLNDSALDGVANPPQPTDILDLAWDTLLDPRQPVHWNDSFWTGMDAYVGLSPGAF